MRIEVKVTFILACQRGVQGQQRYVLVHVGEVAGMEGVTVLHG